MRDTLLLAAGGYMGILCVGVAHFCWALIERRRRRTDTGKLLRRLILQQLDAQERQASSNGYLMASIAELRHRLEWLNTQLGRRSTTDRQPTQPGAAPG
jgi:hypothetical protein